VARPEKAEAHATDHTARNTHARNTPAKATHKVSVKAPVSTLAT
jgi:hypothetical protein